MAHLSAHRTHDRHLVRSRHGRSLAVRNRNAGCKAQNKRVFSSSCHF